VDWERSEPLGVTCKDESATKVEVVSVAPYKALVAMVSGRKLIEVREVDG
jgi:hypothetical protein